MPVESDAATLKRDNAGTGARLGAGTSAFPGIDFLHPEGDPGLLGPGSMGWKVSANPVVSAVGGIAAVILELSEKHVRAGVWDHSTFKTDPIKRMERTGMAAACVTYGPTKLAQTTFDRVTRMHERVTGTTHDGAPYEAMNPELLTWVHVTAAWGFLNAYIRYADPTLSLEDQDRYYREGEVLGKGFGAQWVPTSKAEAEAYMEEMTPKLYANETVQEFLALVRDATPLARSQTESAPHPERGARSDAKPVPTFAERALGAAGKPMQRLVTQAAIDLLPKKLQDQCGVQLSPFVRPTVRPMVRALAGAAGAAVRRMPDTPANQACRRMGVSTDCLR